jgi:ribosomal-protein-alanine N-acetyltransferase
VTTERLELVIAEPAMLRAALQSPAALAESLAATVPETWPPQYVDRAALEYSLQRRPPGPDGFEWWLYFVLLKHGTERTLIGTAGYKAPPSADGTVELGYSIVSDHQGLGYATEAVHALLNHAFSTARVARVIAETHPELTPSIGVLRKCGFRLIGDGSKPGVIRFEILRAEVRHPVLTPIDIPTRETTSFFAAHLRQGAQLIEVGCGEGHVARLLTAQSFRVVALDSDSGAVAKARGHGVPAEVANWPDYRREPVDAIAFTRSLHHMHALASAVARARELMRPSGVLLVEDFAYEATDAGTINWFVNLLRDPAGAAMIQPVAGEFVTELLAAKDANARWHQSHDHDLHSIEAMSRAVAERYPQIETETVPYLYRYLIPVLPETREAAAFVQYVFDEERRLGGEGRIMLIGRRLVGR